MFSSTAFVLMSKKSTLVAPLLNASMPSAPVPQKASSTFASTTASSSIENIELRNLSVVGLTCELFGEMICLAFNDPLTILIHFLL